MSAKPDGASGPSEPEESAMETNALTVNERLSIPMSEIRFRFARSGGPGGQNVNKVATKATLLWDLASSAALDESQRARLRDRLPGYTLTAEGVVQVSSSRERDQARNRQDSIDKFCQLLREALKRRKKRRPTKPTRGSIERRIKAKKQRAAKKKQRKAPRLED